MECAVDLGSGLRWRKLTDPCLFLVTDVFGLHSKPQDCGASVASAAGPFTTTTTTKKDVFQLKIHWDEVQSCFVRVR